MWTRRREDEMRQNKGRGSNAEDFANLGKGDNHIRSVNYAHHRSGEDIKKTDQKKINQCWVYFIIDEIIYSHSYTSLGDRPYVESFTYSAEWESSSGCEPPDLHVNSDSVYGPHVALCYVADLRPAGQKLIIFQRNVPDSPQPGLSL